MNNVVLLLGSNMGDRTAQIDLAEKFIAQQIGEITKESAVYESSPWGKTDQQNFVNKVLVVKTAFNPSAVLEACLSIEENMGRIRTVKWAQRTIDIDILFYDDKVVAIDNLIIPHPEIQNRKFTLVLLNDIIPHFVHPILNKSMAALLDECTDQGTVNKLNVNGLTL